jgi:hypothetical protein
MKTFRTIAAEEKGFWSGQFVTKLGTDDEEQEIANAFAEARRRKRPWWKKLGC